MISPICKAKSKTKMLPFSIYIILHMCVTVCRQKHTRNYNETQKLKKHTLPKLYVNSNEVIKPYPQGLSHWIIGYLFVKSLSGKFGSVS